jgi:hypothetical protein
VKRHIRNAVAAAKRMGVTLQFSRFAKRLRDRCKSIAIDDGYILIELMQVADDLGVEVEGVRRLSGPVVDTRPRDGGGIASGSPVRTKVVA